MDRIVDLFNLNPITMLIALINVVIMVVIVYFLVIRRLKKNMAAKKAKADDVFAENKRLNQEVVETRQKYAALIKEANEKIAVMTKEAAKTAEDKAQKIVDGAKADAVNVITAAKQEMEAERLRMEQYFKEHITSLAVDMAAKVLEREVREQDNSKILDDCLDKWSS